MWEILKAKLLEVRDDLKLVDRDTIESLEESDDKSYVDIRVDYFNSHSATHTYWSRKKKRMTPLNPLNLKNLTNSELEKVFDFYSNIAVEPLEVRLHRIREIDEEIARRGMGSTGS